MGRRQAHLLVGRSRPASACPDFPLFFLILRRLPRSTLFPYTTLFRSVDRRAQRLGLTGAQLRLLSRVRRQEGATQAALRSEEHTSELQSQFHLVCRLLLEKKKTRTTFCRVSPLMSPTRVVLLAPFGPM